MKNKIYFAGFMYWDKDGAPKSFEIVKDKESGNPCLSNDPNGLKETESFASLYEISDDCKSAHLVDARDLCMSPIEVKFSIEQIKMFKEAIANSNF